MIWDMKFDKDDDLWFTDQQSNSIWKYFMKENKFEKYIIPTNGSYPISIVFDSKDRIWFTEWTENKIGVVKSDTMNQLPILLNTSKDKLIIDTTNGNGDTLDIYIYNNILNNTIDTKYLTNESQYKTANISMFVTSSISKTGQLVNLTNTLSKNQLPLSDIPHNMPWKITLDISPNANTVTNVPDLENHTLTISARYNNDITISKIIDLVIR